jgi:integrase
VTEHGHRSWCFHYRTPGDGKRVRLSLGTYPGTSLAAARGRAIEARSHVEAGTDPRSIIQATASMTFAALIETFLADPGREALRSKGQVERRLRKNVLPVIGLIKLSELRRRDVRNVIDPILRRGRPIEANRVFEDTRTAIRWAVVNEYLDANPLDGMSKPAKERRGDRVLSDDEIRALWRALPQALPAECQTIVKLCLTCGQRLGEVTGLRRGEVDFAAHEWRLPAARVKNKSPHTVPLSDLALRLIREVMPAKGDAIFSLTMAEVSQKIFHANLRKAFGIEPWSAHDLRRTCLNNLAKLGVSPHIIAHVANHRSITKSGVTFAHYVTHSFEREKREALNLWADRLTAIIGDGAAATVTHIGRRKAVS